MKTFTQFLTVSMTVAIGLLTAGSAKGITFTETTDAGQLLNTATSIGSVSEINGLIENNNDIDLFKFVIDQTGMTTFDGTPAAMGQRLNINLFLFNDKGNPLFSLEPVNDDAMKFDFATTAGTYFLGIGSDDLDALDAVGNRIAGNDSGIDNPNGILAGWQISPESFGAYNIKISTVPTNAVPTPALLPVLLGFGLKHLRKRKQSAALAVQAVKV